MAEMLVVSLRMPGRTDVMMRFGDQALVSLGNFVVALLLARLLGPAQFGLFALLWIVVTLALGSHWALITSPLQTTLPNTQDSDRHELFGALLVHAVLLGVLAAIVALVVLVVVSETSPTSFTMAGVAMAMLLIVAQEFARRWLLGTERPGLALASDALRHVGTLVSLVMISTLGGPISLGLCMSAIALCALVALVPLRGEVIKTRIRTATVLKHGKSHGEIGRWLLPSVMLQTLSAGAPVYALGSTVGVASAGGYRAALNLLSPVVSLTEALETFLPLRCSQTLRLTGHPAWQHKLWRWAVPLGACCVAFTSVVWMAGAPLLILIFGEAYQSYAPVLLPLAIAMLLQFATYILNVRLRTIGQVRAIFMADGLSTTCLLLLLVLLPLDAVGVTAAWALAVAQVVKVIMLTVANTLDSTVQVDAA